MESMNLDKKYSPEVDATLVVEFLMHPVYNVEKSEKEGRPIFDDRECVKIQIPGDKGSVVFREVRDLDRQRFAKRYEAFKARTSQEAVAGTPLAAWPQVTRAQVEELAYFNVRTVEQLSAVPDNVAQKFMGITQLRQKARDFVIASKEAAPLSQLRSELDAKANEVATLRNMVEELKKQMDAKVDAKPQPQAQGRR